MTTRATKAELARMVELLESRNAELKDQLSHTTSLLSEAIDGLLAWNGLPGLKPRTPAETREAACS